MQKKIAVRTRTEAMICTDPAACPSAERPNATRADAMEPSVTDMPSQFRKVRSFAKKVFGSMRLTLLGGSIGPHHWHSTSIENRFTTKADRDKS
eukprot:2559395-Rhodomonas_salina.1